MKICILCTDPLHPVNPWLERWAEAQRAGSHHQVSILRDSREAEGGDLLFLVSCHQIVSAAVRNKFQRTMVLHASALPSGRGMSPHVWQILEGAQKITVTLLDAVDALDRGDIWNQVEIRFVGTELHDEIHALLFEAELELMTWAVDHALTAQPRPQPRIEGSSYRKRSPEDSRIDPHRPLAESFELLRIADPVRYPAFFDYRGQRYRLRIEKM